jgi:Double zinc ribbon
MALIQFTENYEDLSTDQGYQFKFLCDKCHNGYLSSFHTSALGTASSLLRAAGNVLGGVFGSAAGSAYEVQQAVGGKAHDEALHAAIEETRSQFHQCKRCGKWVCPENCWNAPRGLCNECAPDVQMELAAAQAAATIEQINEGVRQQNLTKGLDLGGDAAATCPSCGAKASGGKFCRDCGGPLKAGVKCPGCGKQFEMAPKFCDECGKKVG